ncbi:hypothetical protein LCA12A_0946 [Lacticaseibacillus casei 12A]|uniref:hypothetical protein n=1 Tax=Lacticaseibacillus paracasei TaxID=1597 RepID=UPI00029791B2|nr:hypothetical protein [Lacticaseibacillus paracasei]EKP98167.1 hypothetical protein LCA12A_0946 [Lacticaseibacillus casei 12A]
MKLSIKPKQKYLGANDPLLISAYYDILIDGHKLPTGVKKIEISMEAGEKPELIIHADLGQLHLDVNALVKLAKETNG